MNSRLGQRKVVRYYDQLASQLPSFAASRATTSLGRRPPNLATSKRGKIVSLTKIKKEEEEQKANRKSVVILDTPITVKRQIKVAPLLSRKIQTPEKVRENLARDIVVPMLAMHLPTESSRDSIHGIPPENPSVPSSSRSNVSIFSAQNSARSMASSRSFMSSARSSVSSLGDLEGIGLVETRELDMTDSFIMPEIPPLALNLTKLLATIPDSPPPSLSPFTFCEEVTQLNEADFEQFLEEDTLWLKSALIGQRWNSDNLYDFIVSITNEQYSIVSEVYLRQYFKITRLSQLLKELSGLDSIPTMAQIVEKSVQSIFNVGTCLVWINIPSAGMLINHSRLMKYPVGTGLVGTCANDKREIVAPNPMDSPLFSEEYDYPFCEDTELVTCTPITNPKTGSLYAVIMCIGKYHKSGASFMYWPQSELTTLHWFTDRLFRVFRRFEDDVQKTYKMYKVFGSCIARQHNFVRLMSHIKGHVNSILNSDDMAVYICENGKYITFQQKSDGIRIVYVQKENLGVASRVFRTKECANVGIPEDDPDFNIAVAGGTKPRGVLAVPMMIGSDVFGVLVVRGKKQGPCFSTSDLEKLSLLAIGLGPVLKKSLAMRRNTIELRTTLRAQDRLASLLQTAESLSRTTENAVLTQTIVGNAKNLVNADRATLFVVDESRTQLVSRFADGTTKPLLVPIRAGIVGHAATTGEVVNIPDCYEDPRFNADVDKRTGYRTRSMMTIPVHDQLGQIIAVAQLMNKLNGEPFTESDVELTNAMCIFVGIALANSTVIERALRTKTRIEAMLDIMMLLNGGESVSTILTKIMNMTRDLIQADRGAIFLLDSSDDTFSSTVTQGEHAPIKIQVGKGIVGYVAEHGETVNIPDAYNDDRFHDGVDKATGYRTRSIIGSPAKNSNGEVLCVIEFINKDLSVNGGVFTRDDEHLVNAFSSFIGLTLERQARESGGPDTAISIVLTNMMTAESTERYDLPHGLTLPAGTLNSIDFRISSTMQLAKAVANMISNLCFTTKFQINNQQLFRFLLALHEMYSGSKLYTFERIVGASHVVHFLLSRTGLGDILSDSEKLALMMATLCHNIDHHDDSYDSQMEIGLSVLFRNRHPLKMHHCEKTIQLLSKEDIDIFAHVDDKVELWNTIIDLILSTDQTSHFDILKNFTNLVYPQMRFNMSNKQHRLLLMQTMIKCSDVFYTVMSFDICERYARQIDSLTGGSQSTAELAKKQVGMMMFVARPMIAMLNELMRSAGGDDTNCGSQLLVNLESNLNRWKELSQQ